MITQAQFDMIPKDLKLRLCNFDRPKLAGRFFKYLENQFTIYSSTVEKVYTDYESELVGIDKNILVVNPNFEKFDSIYSFIDNKAVSITKIKIILAEHKGVKGVYMLGPCAISGKTISYSLKNGLKALLKGKFEGGAFLPVLKLGDLSELPDDQMPVISIYKIDPKSLKSRSEFEINDLSKSIIDNISLLGE